MRTVQILLLLYGAGVTEEQLNCSISPLSKVNTESNNCSTKQQQIDASLEVACWKTQLNILNSFICKDHNMLASKFSLFMLVFCFQIPPNESNPLILQALNLGLDAAIPSLTGQFANVAKGFGGIGKFMYELINKQQDSAFQDEVRSKLDAISNKLRMMHDDITKQTSDLGEVVSAISFSQSFMEPINTLVNFMNDMLLARNEATVISFLNQCNHNDPMAIADKLTTRILDDITNPFKFAMEADVLKSNRTYQTWRLTTAYIMSSAARITAVYSGLTKVNEKEIIRRMRKIETLYEKIESVLNRMAENYARTYWPATVENLINNKLDRNLQYNYNHQALAIDLKDSLREIYTSDEFLILTYVDSKTEVVNSLNSREDQMICISRKGVHACVYRSKQSLQYKSNQLAQLKNAMETYIEAPQNSNVEPGIMRQNAKDIYSNMKSAAGLVAVIGSNYKLIYEATLNQTSGYPYGPCWMMPATVRMLPIPTYPPTPWPAGQASFNKLVTFIVGLP